MLTNPFSEMDPGLNDEKKLSPGKGTGHQKRPVIAVSALHFLLLYLKNLALSSILFLKSLPSTGVTFYILHSQLSNLITVS
jgi:hypothetical protein